MFDDRLIFESPGKLPGQVKPTNIRHTHFSRNPKIAAFLKAYHYVKEFGEGFDRICREQEANGANSPSFRTDEFILKITVPKVTENDDKVTEKVTVNDGKRTESELNRAEPMIEPAKVIEKVTENSSKVTEKVTEKISKMIEKAKSTGDELSENRITILKLMIENPYITKSELAKAVGISENSISRNIEAL